jgi:hypothetical protein
MNYTARGTPSGGTNGSLGSVPVSFSSGRHQGKSQGTWFLFDFVEGGQ